LDEIQVEDLCGGGVARIPDELVARLKAEVSLQRLVEGRGVELRQVGADLVGRCPFHDDATASLVISPAKNLWHCLGACQTGGSVVDWVMRAEGVSFRHAVELLRDGMPEPAAGSPIGVKSSSVRRLPAPVTQHADDSELLGQVTDFYHRTLLDSPDALGYLTRRRIAHPEAIEVFKLGFANRTLGLRLPEKNRKAGADLRGRLTTLGVFRASGHEHFAGSLVIPVLDEHGAVVEMYGRKVTESHKLRAGTPLHLYLPGPHRGVWNEQALAASDEIIVCESLIDGLSLWCAGFRHVTASFGAAGFTADHAEAFCAHDVRRVLIAYDHDPAGDKAATMLAAELGAQGVECFRVVLPAGQDINDVAVAATNPTDALGRLVRHAVWIGNGTPPNRRATSPAASAAPVVTVSFQAAETPVIVEKIGTSSVVEPVVGPAVDVVESVGAVDPLLVSPSPPAPAEAAPVVSEREMLLSFADRRWRVRGLDKASSFDLLRVNIMVSAPDGRGGLVFHVDTLDLYAARARAAFIAAAAAECKVDIDVIKRDLGRVLLACEALADQAVTAAQTPADVVEPMTDTDRAAALALLHDPELVGRIGADFAAVGMVGETANCLVGYLAAISRKLPRPLAVVVQSTSAAGKSALMDAVLGFVPGEDLVRFSAMTGQSLFYVGETDLAHKVLAIAEEEGATRAAYALKLLQSEGELSIASTGKDTASGKLVTHTYKVTGPTGIFLTTTSVEVDEELLNRCLVLSVDEDREQTRAIHARQRAGQTLAGLLAHTAADAVRKLHQDAQRLLEPLAVVNPFADRLTFADGATRTRRDHVKYLTLISAVTLLHQHQRQITTTTHDGRTIRYVETTLADIAIANTLAHQVLGQCLDELPPGTRRLLAALHSFVAAEAARKDVEPPMVRFTRRDLREALGFGDTQLKVHLARLVDLELVAPIRTDRGGFCYELAWAPPQGGDGQTAPQRVLPGLLDPTTLLGHGVTAAAMTAHRSGSNGSRSGGGRPPVGARSGGGRPALRGVNAQPNGRFRGRDGAVDTDGTDPVAGLPAVVVADAVAVAGGVR
jgi:DNA primase